MTDRRSGKAIFRELGKLVTEQRNPRSRNLDRLSTAQILKLMNQEDRRVPLAVGRELPNITRAVDLIVERLARGGRLFYVGAGTSGRLGVLDATECPPTFGTPRTLVQGIIAGGRKALVRSVEGSEDDSKTSQQALRKSTRPLGRGLRGRLQDLAAGAPEAPRGRARRRGGDHGQPADALRAG